MRFAVALLAATGCFVVTAAAQTPSGPDNPDVLAGVYACAELASDAERLACYDAAVGRLRTAQLQGEFAAVDRARVEQVEREAFGFALPSLPRLAFPQLRRDNDDSANGAPDRDGLAELSLVIERLERRGDGRTVFRMQNGQRWVQIEPERVRPMSSGAAVTIRRAAMGAYLLSSANGGPAYRVRREE